ncbi:MAG: hypothetical protein R3Y07_00080 [Eubacteriales bacterium]
MAKKSKEIEEQQSIFDQVSLEKTPSQQLPSQPIPVKPSEVKRNLSEEMALNDPTKIMENPPLPDEVKKDGTHIFNEVINISAEEMSESVNIELEPLGSLPVHHKMVLSYEGEFAEKLGSFDREVIDAIATLAPHTQVISSTTIYRVITGKQEGSINLEHRKKVDQSMERCGNYVVSIDLTNQYLEANPSELGNTKSMTYSGRLISFEKVEKKAKNGSNTYYKILSIPPIFRLAESIGKVSQFPLTLLDTPIKKTDQIIAVQSFLLRTIDQMKKGELDSRTISWEILYEIAEIDLTKRQYKQRVRENVSTILTDWVTKGFILSFDIQTAKKNNILRIEF